VDKRTMYFFMAFLKIIMKDTEILRKDTKKTNRMQHYYISIML